MNKCHRTSLNKSRQTSGQALALTLVATLVLILVGVGFVNLMQIFGGSGEQRNATDAGVLNLNKNAVAQGVVLPASYLDQNQFLSMYAKSTGLLGSDGSLKVSLGTYNDLIGSAMLVAMNASADGMSGSSGGQSNASKLIKTLEISTDSVGGRLKSFLEDPSHGNWAAQYFNSTSLANSARMLGQDAQALWDSSQYQVGYMESPASDKAASNVALDQLAANLPYTYDASGNSNPMKVPQNMVANDSTNLRGYQPIKFANISYPLYAVPTQPGQQPHLVSNNVFVENLKQPGSSDGVVLPPNAFKAGANTKVAVSNSTLSASAAGIVGMPSGASPASIPHGFIIIDNSLNPPMSSISLPNGDTWDAVEATTGTLVYRPNHVFSTEGTANGQPYNALSSWLQTPRSANFNPENGPPISDDQGHALLYDGNGNPISSKAQAAKEVPYDTNSNDVVLATDQNSDPNGANPDSDCVQMATPTLPDNLSPFNRAYHPNANASSGSTRGANLISTEQAKVFVLSLYNQYRTAGNMGGSFSGKTFPVTGLRLYPGNKLPNSSNQYAYAPAGAGQLPLGDVHVSTYGDPSVLGKVTVDGTIQSLLEQTTVPMSTASGTQLEANQVYARVDGDSSHSRLVKTVGNTTPATEMRNFIKQRMKEIKPTASDNDVDQVFKQTTLSLGSRYYVYLSNQSWVVSSNPPPWATYIPTPDGIRHAFTHAYSVSGSMVDVQHDFGSNDYPFNTNNVIANAVDGVSYQSSSGANGLLGYVKFFEQVVLPAQ